MGNDGLPISLGIIIAAAVFGALLFAGLVIMAVIGQLDLSTVAAAAG